MPETAFYPAPRIAEDSRLALAGVRSVMRLLGGGATAPFIARYRKEQTGGFDELQIRDIEEKAAYLTELDARRRTILSEIESQGKLTPELRAKIESCWVKAVLEHLYALQAQAPHPGHDRTRARAEEPLARRILDQPATGTLEAAVAPFIDPMKGVADAKSALAGARDIVAETIADRSDVRALVRDVFKRDGILVSAAIKGKANEPTKFEAYYDFQEKTRSVPSHRFLAIRRGTEEGVLRHDHIDVDTGANSGRAWRHWPNSGPGLAALPESWRPPSKTPSRGFFCPSIESEMFAEMKVSADRRRGGGVRRRTCADSFLLRRWAREP